MTARDKTRPFTTKWDELMRDEIKPYHAQELALGADRFNRVLRTALVETTKTGQRDIRHVLFNGDERRLWTTTRDSHWHRYLCKPIDPSTIH